MHKNKLQIDLKKSNCKDGYYEILQKDCGAAELFDVFWLVDI